ncbi:hypothetical protein [Azospirillum lipoferum]|nr:hypothetical protein [Azospirillum lipoferum]
MLFLRDIDADVQLRCRACGHGGVLPRAMLERRFGPNYPVLSIAPHYRCSRCDSRDIESRPILAPPPVASFEAANEEPSFDAPLAALNGLLASLRGDAPAAEEQAVSPPPPPPLAPAAPVRSKPLSELPLADLVADGPADDGAAPLWEPVSLADMAARLGAIGPGDDDSGRDGEPDVGEPVDDGWDDPAPPGRPAGKETARDNGPDADPDADPDEGGDEGGDETLAAMHRLLAQAHWSEDDEPEAPAPATARRFEQPGTEEDIDGPTEEDGPAVFSHKMLVRKDFEEDWEEPEAEFDRRRAEEERDTAESFDEEEEPSDEEILSFAIRDPEKPAARPAEWPAIRSAKPAAPPPADEPLDFDQHRAERRAQRPPPPPEDEEGFDRTLAALRSMIEDAANDPDDDAQPPPRKPPAAEARGIGKGPESNSDRNPGAATAWQDEDRSGDDPLSGFDADPLPDPEPDPEPDPDRDPAPAGRRSAQEREIEEAMKALRGLIEEEVASEPPPPPPPSQPAPPPKPRAGKPRPPPRREPPAPPAEEAEPTEPPARQGSKPVDPTPLSKTIAALRGMLELDGKRKR